MGTPLIPELGITELQEKFCQEYVALPKPNGTQAAKNAGYSEKTASVKAHCLLRQDKIQNRIGQLRHKYLYRAGLTPDDVHQQWAAIGMFDIRELFNKDGTPKTPDQLSAVAGAAVSGVKVKIRKVATYTRDNEEENETVVEKHFLEEVEYKLNDKHTALSNFAKHAGMLNNDTPEGEVLKSVAGLLDRLNPTIGPPSEKDVTAESSLLPAESR